MSEITRDLPNNEYLAAVGANSPSAANPFVTISDITHVQSGATTDGVAFTLLVPAPIPVGSVVKFRSIIKAYQTGGASGTIGDSYSMTVVGAIKNIGGVHSIVGGIDNYNEQDNFEEVATELLEVRPYASANGLEIEVKGETNKNFSWISKTVLY
jgi:hypothetical protein